MTANVTVTERRPIKAIETIYRGFRFRSRLEARYAVFFDYMRVDWEYEKEGYIIDGTPYLPDFWLSRYQMHVEIKGEPPTRKELDLAYGLQMHTERAVAVFHGLPREYFGTVFAWDMNYSNAGNSEISMGLTSIPSHDGSFALFCPDTNKEWFADPLFEIPLPVLPTDTCITEWCPRATTAEIFAKMARFEHGENPAPDWTR